MKRFADLPDGIRRPLALAQGIVFGWLVFFAGPSAAIELNEEMGWPRWQAVPFRVAGAALIAAGVGLFVYCSNLFARLGHGTPVPSEPPRQLVTSGLYQYSRNPIYVAYGIVLVGTFLWFGHATLLAYVLVCFLAMHAIILWWEEPVLRRRFGYEFIRYARTVRRWL